MAYTFLASSKISNLISLVSKNVWRLLLHLSHLLQNYLLDDVPNKTWSFVAQEGANFRRASSNLSSCKGRRMLTNILLLVNTNSFVKELTLFLPGLAPLQSSRTKFSVAWLEIFRPDTRHHHLWRTSTTFLKTSHLCNVSKRTYKICTFELNVNSSTTLRLPHRLPSISTKVRVKQMKELTTMKNHDPRMNRANPKYRALLGIVGTWSTSCDFCNCLLSALCVLDSVCSCFVCFLSACVVTLCLCLFWPLGLKNPLSCKTSNRKPL
jgi:hypothetical protein